MLLYIDMFSEKIMNKFIVYSFVLAAFLAFNINADHHAKKGMKDGEMKPHMIAKKWTEASYTSKDKALKVVKNFMAEDGYNYPGRFVGFGFNFDPLEDEMTVNWVIENSPAVGVLQEGDTFVSVNGVPATRENRDSGKLVFAGLPGENVNAVVRRDGKNVEVSFARGLVDPRYSKSQVLTNIESANADNWGAIEHKINEIAVNKKERTVYVWSWHKSLDVPSQKEFEAHVVTRYAFNEEGKVIAIANLTEDALIQSQLGFRVTR